MALALCRGGGVFQLGQAQKPDPGAAAAGGFPRAGKAPQGERTRADGAVPPLPGPPTQIGSLCE